MANMMSGLDYNKADISLREKLSFTRSGVLDIVRKIAKYDGVYGTVLLSTCNRTEIYLSCQKGLNPGQILCQAAEIDYEQFAEAFVTRRGADCTRHLMEVASGLQSQILGEDQILTQVKTASAIAREAQAIDAELETLFRNASSCGKTVKSEMCLKGVKTSAAHSAVSALKNFFGELKGKTAVVIGNGEMGRLTAGLLVDSGCDVTVTLRSYRHGETVVPLGCKVVSYDDRYAVIDGVDLVVSATTSPHYTVAIDELKSVKKLPKAMVDLAIPRDIEPETADMCRVFNVDNLGDHSGFDDDVKDRVYEIVYEYMHRYYRWRNYRKCMPAIEDLKEAVIERVIAHMRENVDRDELAETVAATTVDLVTSGLAGSINPQDIKTCANGIRSRTR